MNNKEKNMKNFGMRFAFTLIELLVVMSIISLLSVIILASVRQVRAKGRDAGRLQDMHQIETALQLFYADKGRFPDGNDCDPGNPTNCMVGLGECIGGECGGRGNSPGDMNILNIVLKPYFSQIPKDPLHDCPDNVNATDMNASWNGGSDACDDKYFYGYDYAHSIYKINPSTGACDVVVIEGNNLGSAVVLSINKFEIITDARRDTCSGPDLNIDNSAYNIVVCKNDTGLSCFSNVQN
jgi:prepilin-type N-terminal cleavage/methylation domain-containing protein